MTEFQQIAQAIAKSGEMQPGSLNIGGVLRPQQATRVIDLIVDSSDILKLVTVERCAKLSKEIDVLGVEGKILTRIPQGVDPENFTEVRNTGPTIEMKAHQLYGRILFDALRDNKDDPQYEAKVLKEWSKAWGRDVTRLAFTGTHDDYIAGDATKGLFERLNAGWPAILKGASTAHKIDKAGYAGTGGVLDYIEYFDAIVAALPDEYKSEECRLIISKTDHERYIRQIGQVDGGLAYMVKGGVSQFLGYEIVANQYMPQGEVMFTPLQNLIYGINTDIERYREVKGTKRCIDYTFDASDDFQVAIPKAAVIGYAH